MKKIISALMLGFLAFSVPVFAGDFFIESVTYDGRCVKVVYGSTEDDSRDTGTIRVRLYLIPSGNDVFRTSKSFQGLRGGGHYMEFCGQRADPDRAAVNVQILHNGKLEDQAQWSAHPRRR